MRGGGRTDSVRIVLDTNVVVSGLLSAFGPPAQIVDLVSAGDLGLVVDDRILAEYEDVLRRPELGLDRWDVGDFLMLVEMAEMCIGAPLPRPLPDPSDAPFLEVAIAGAVDALVTGNARHFAPYSGRLVIPIVSPKAFLDLLGRRS